MPIEVKELHIKAVVAPEAPARSEREMTAMLEKIKKEILQECLQQIKHILHEQKER